jgi:diguanylate cyclase (GGDEF)-like protein
MRPGVYVSIRRGLLVLAALLLEASVPAEAADAPPLILEHLTTADGLPQATVMATLQDSQGFVWLGTEDGLVRYDGHEIVRYAHSPNARDGLPGNFVYQIAEDRNHDLWVALKDAGLARWNRATDSFTVYRHEAGNPNSLSSDAARTLIVGPQGRIWLGTSDAGIDVLDPSSGRIEHLRHRDNDPTSLIDDRIFTLALDRSGTPWVGTEKGLDRWSAKERVFAHYRRDLADPHSLSGEEISGVWQERSGALWVSTYDGGLDRMDPDGRVSRVFRHDPRLPGSLASDDVRAILEDQAGHFWVGTAEGLDLLERSTGQIVHYRQDVSDPESLRDSYVMSLYEDETGLVWIGTRSGGVSRWNPRSWELGGHRPEWLSGKPVTSFAEAGGHKVWVSSMGGGLVQFDGDTGTATNLDTLLREPNSLGDNRVMSLRRDRHGDLWIGTMNNGLFVLTAAGKLESIPVKEGDAHSISAAGIMTLFESHSGAIWIGTHGGGANILDPTTRTVRQLPYAPSQQGSTNFAHVSAFAEDSRGNMWIGTDGGGLDLARPDGTIVKVFRHDPKDQRSLPANTVFAVAVDAQDRVWVGTDGGGLAQAVGSAQWPDSIAFKVNTREQGLSGDTVYGVVPDSGGQIWLSGYAGLARYDPQSGAFKTYHREHGLQGEEFDFNAYYRLPDGRICFGGPGGFNIFDPARVGENRTAPRVALTRVSIMGVPVSTGRPSWLLDRLNLNFRANIVTLDFGALDFTSPKRNRLAYRMAGLTDRWIDLGTQHRITLTNLDAGDHVLEVRAANADSVWSRESLRLAIHRDPAPWRSPWAYATYILVALALVGYRMRLQREKFERVVREQRRLEASAKALTERIIQVRTLVEALPDKLWVVDATGHLQWSPNAETMGTAEELAAAGGSSEVPGSTGVELYRTPSAGDAGVAAGNPAVSGTVSPRWVSKDAVVDLAPPETLPDVLRAISQTAADGKQRKLEYRETDAAGVRHSYELRFTRRERGDVVVVRQDTSERTAAAEHIERLAYIDTLTGLPNRQRCLETAESMFARAQAAQESVAVVYLDLNSFKRVNDTFGHSVGDAVLRIVAGKLERSLEAFKPTLRHVSLARFGGDEFIVLLRHSDARSSAGKLAQALCGAFEDPIEYNGLEFYSAPSVGLAVYPDDGEDVGTVFKHADTAMYHAKGGSSGAIAVYTAAMSSRLRDWLDLEARLRRAVQDDILQLNFQPKFSIEDNRMVGVEALLRWRDPEHGDISPVRFIEIAEDSGLIVEIGSWVVRAACQQLRQWMDRGCVVPIAINVSAKELLHGDPAKVLEAEAAAAGVPPSLIEIEITESLLVKDSTAVQSALERLRQLGCRIALDDFGTGYSSLAYITRFPPNRIKIDKAFVNNVDRSASDAAIANAILSLGASLNLIVTAEGVERPGQLEWLRSRGCHEAQGFLLSRPLSAAELERRFLQSPELLADAARSGGQAFGV